MPYGGNLPNAPSWRLAEKLYDRDGALRLKRAENGDTLRFEGEKGHEVQAQYDSEARDVYCQFRVIHGWTYEVLREHKLTGWKCHFTDHRPCGWHKVRCVQAATGRQAYYEGPLHGEKLVMKITPKGNFYYYEGERKSERLVRIWHAEGGTHRRSCDFLAFFEGEPKQERLVRQEWSNGDVVFFEGEHPTERRYKRVFASGTVQHFQGALGKECVVREEKPSGVQLLFTGDKGKERKVREDHPTGAIRLFAGERGREYITMEIGFGQNHECTVSQCDAPSQDGSRIRRILFPNGTMLVYPSLADEPNVPPPGVSHSAHPRRMITPDGRLCKETRGGLGWKRVHEDDDSGSMGWEQRKRFKNAAGEMWSELERLAETGGVKENALVALGTHFKKLNSELD
jgi:hypothetical protein